MDLFFKSAEEIARLVQPFLNEGAPQESVIGPRLPIWAMQQSRQLIWGTSDVLTT